MTTINGIYFTDEEYTLKEVIEAIKQRKGDKNSKEEQQLEI